MTKPSYSLTGLLLGAFFLLFAARCNGAAAVPMTFEPPAAGSTDSLGSVTLADHTALLNLAIHSAMGKLVCTAVQKTSSGNSETITYNVAGRAPVHVTVSAALNAPVLSITFNADQPVIAAADYGPFPAALAARKIAVPYYTNDVWYSASLRTFLNAWWDVNTTHGTLFAGSQVQYAQRTDGTLLPLHEKLMVAASANVDDMFPSLSGPASPYMAELAGRTIFDIWAGGFASIRDGLVQLGDYGITNCVGIIHNWQHAGYDNGLPQHYPANDKLGGDAELKEAVAAGKADGFLMALHENYIDYYPNYPGFNPAGVAINRDSSRILAWLNHGTGIQSFQAKPSWMVRNAMTQSPEIHQRYGTDASFIDVNSAVEPYSKRDMDASVPNGGTMQLWIKAAADLWAYERKVYGGPVFGEGANHWYYSGLLDGVEAQLGAGIPNKAGAAVPLFVDFDLLRMHPLQVNHGMGYYERWTPSGSRTMTAVEFDAYRMQEIAFGHAPFLGTAYWNNIPQALIETNLIGPVARRYGDVQTASIRYILNGAWVDSSAAAQAGAFQRVSVQYANGLQVVANADSSPLQWNGLTLPQYGWAAKARDLLAYSALCGEAICDYAQTNTSLFANARNAKDTSAPSAAPDSRLNAAGNVVNFGLIQTDGMVSIQLNNGQWVLRPFPRNRNFTIRLSTQGFAPPRQVKADGGSAPAATPSSGPAGWWTLNLNGAKSYSWPASPATLPLPR